MASFQHPYGAAIAWNQVAAPGGSSFTFIKATEGTGYVNPYYAGDEAHARANGLLVGAYHFARPSTTAGSAAAQAQYFVQHAGGAATLDAAGELPPVLDLEVNGGLNAAQLISWTQQWLTEVTRLTGRTPIIYTFPNFWPNDMGNTTAFGGYPLWIASYSGSPVLLPGWHTWTFWQYTDNATVPGISGAVDLNQFNGTLAQLKALAAGTTPPVNTTQAPPPTPTGTPGMPAGNNPVGRLDTLTASPGAMRLTGWSIDPNTAQPLDVHVYVNGRFVGRVAAAGSRPDVASAYPAAGPNHGYVYYVADPPGTYHVCAYGINVGAGNTNPLLGCRTVTIPGAPRPSGRMPGGHNPVGTLDGVTSTMSGAVEVRGWAIDPDTTAADDVHIYVNGLWITRTAAATYRPDVAAAFPGAGSYHGFDVLVPVSAGRYTVCAFMINMGAGSTNPPLGCRAVTVP